MRMRRQSIWLIGWFRFFETEFHSIAQIGLRLEVTLPPLLLKAGIAARTTTLDILFGVSPS